MTVKIKIILLLLFLGGGIFYGLKIWQGKALGCPEPIIQDYVKNYHHEHDDILPYHGHLDGHPFSSSDVSSYPGSADIYPGGGGSSFFDSGSLGGAFSGLASLGGVSGLGSIGPGSGFDGYNGVYSNTPGPIQGPSQGQSSAYSGPTYLPPHDNFANSPPSGAAVAPDSTQIGQPFTNRRQGFRGRQISEETQTIVGDLLFRFLGVNTEQCRRRFVCELEFRNPFLRYAVRYIG